MKNIVEWREKASKEELKLYELMRKFQSKYFEDLTLNKFEESEITKIVYENGDIDYDDIPFINLPIVCTIRVLEQREVDKKDVFCAQFKPKGKIIEFQKGQYEDQMDINMLHEMIHAYDYELRKWLEWRDYVQLYLYEKLRGKIGKNNLWAFFNYESNRFYRVDSSHNLLFLLKSLDLDIRLKRELGTVFSYERTEWYKKK